MYVSFFKCFQGKSPVFIITSLCIAFTVCVILLCRDMNSNLLQDQALFNNVNNTGVAGEGFISSHVHIQNQTPFKMVCYYNWGKSNDQLLPEEIPFGLCTHINVAFAGINGTDYSLQISSYGMEMISRLVLLKLKNKNLKIIISVGGAGCDDFSPMVQNHSNRKQFINSTMKFIKKFKLDGLDVDWEWPSKDREKIKFIQLLREIREEFNKHKKKYILSIAAAVVESYINLFYYVNYIKSLVDFINLMTYDYHFYTMYYPITDYNAPLYPSAKDKNSLFSNINVNFSVNYWISQSVPKEKLILGIPTYGHSYRLMSSLNHELHSPASGYGSVGVMGFAVFPDICNFLNLLDTFKVFDDDAKVPYAYNQYDWISYDDEESVAIKAKFIIKEQLGGAMFYSLNSEDYRGTCRNVKFPLIKKVQSILNPAVEAVKAAVEH